MPQKPTCEERPASSVSEYSDRDKSLKKQNKSSLYTLVYVSQTLLNSFITRPNKLLSFKKKKNNLRKEHKPTTHSRHPKLEI